MPEDFLLSARFLAWYTSAMFAVGVFLLLLVSVARGADLLLFTLQTIMAVLAVVFAVFGMVLRSVRRDHWLNQSLAVRGLLAFAALFSTLLMLASVVG
jgi:hypothetical protein